MAFERNLWGFDGEITFICDQCGEEIHTDTADFHGALENMKSEGWKTRKADGDWEHICPTCLENEQEDELSEEFDD